ncbi:glycerol-3-phosphate responsive antiterminator [Kocuria koreensis]|uniref:Glycerol-3-phosphate responsive antiterminator n=1 Tax=Rothia koreensis TaxID=592378 RepID=A0A7M3SW40_9MICC|nr:glycerol-3-phosphate responsive antiterminator [Rothia koreensis]MUN56005.1 glycerol-3-phosphate responsive antiterminator [Rothia koreensis]
MKPNGKGNAANLLASLEADPVIASIKDEKSLSAALRSEREVFFILYGTLIDIAGIVDRVKNAGKLALVNIDFIEGISSHDEAVRWFASTTDTDGILTSKPTVVRAARKAGLIGIQRSFLVDSISYRQLPRTLKQGEPDFVEILPGCVPRVIEWLRDDFSTPIIAGGLVCERREVNAALEAGALAIATSDQKVWKM